MVFTWQFLQLSLERGKMKMERGNECMKTIRRIADVIWRWGLRGGRGDGCVATRFAYRLRRCDPNASESHQAPLNLIKDTPEYAHGRLLPLKAKAADDVILSRGYE